MLRLTAPQHTIQASVRLSGSKSISNRLLVLKEVLQSPVQLINLSDSEDTQLLQRALEKIKSGTAHIDIGHAGTDMRFLTACLSTLSGKWFITGSERMQQRPIGELVDALRQLGADISYTGKKNFPPLEINGKALTGNYLEIDGSVSSQFISALLLIAPVLKNGLRIVIKGTIVSRPYIQMTVDLLKHFGRTVDFFENNLFVHPTIHVSDLVPAMVVESDWSSASYWYSICALSPGSEIELSFLNKNSSQADSVLPLLYEQLGVKTEMKKESLVISHTKSVVGNFHYDFTNCPDIAPTIALTCFGLGIAAQLEGLNTLKIKETDRIEALKTELEKFGVPVNTTPTSISIPLHNTFDSLHEFEPPFFINTYNDHRMAMSFAPLCLVAKSMRIQNPEVVAKSYPAFWEDLKSTGFNVNLQP